MKRSLFFLACIAFPLFAADEWPGVKYAEVRAYAWKGTAEEVVLKDMTLKDGAIDKDGALLTPEQVKRLLAAVTGTHPMHAVAACYTPNNAFVFYNAEKKPVAYVEICFDCLGKRIQPAGIPGPVDLPALATIFEELKLPLGKYADAAAFAKKFDELKSRMSKSNAGKVP